MVFRQTGPWIPAVHEYLKLCYDKLGARLPEVLGIDQQRREKLSFLPGTVLSDAAPAIPWGQHQAEKYIRDLQKAIEDLAEYPKRDRPREEICEGYHS